MKTQDQERAAIELALNEYYFRGIYEGNVESLMKVFHPGTLLFGDIKDQPYAKTLDQYLQGVANRTSPRDSGKSFQTDIAWIEIIRSIAVAKVQVKMYEFNYYDFLSFHKIDGQWVIVNKMLTHVES